MVIFHSLIFILVLVALFVLSRQVNQAIFQIVFRVTHSRTIAISWLSLILFPGTVIHELSHYFTANILGVPTGKITLIPEIAQKNVINLGSVNVAVTDPVRRLIIGLAPEINGLIGLSVISYFLPNIWQKINFTQPLSNFQTANFYILIALIYLAFTIANCMFSSRSDLKGLWVFLILVGVLVLLGYQSGLSIHINGSAAQIINQILTYLTIVISFVTFINLLILLSTHLILRIIR
jgi:hypothetical protein